MGVHYNSLVRWSWGGIGLNTHEVEPAEINTSRDPTMFVVSQAYRRYQTYRCCQENHSGVTCQVFAEIETEAQKRLSCMQETLTPQIVTPGNTPSHEMKLPTAFGN